jgi:hypothetical protein
MTVLRAKEHGAKRGGQSAWRMGQSAERGAERMAWGRAHGAGGIGKRTGLRFEDRGLSVWILEFGFKVRGGSI